MPKVTFDGINRIIQVNSGERVLLFEIDVYNEWKTWSLSNLGYTQAIIKWGGDTISTGTIMDKSFTLINDWRIRPYGEDQVLLIDGNVFTDNCEPPYVIPTDNLGGSCSISGDIDLNSNTIFDCTTDPTPYTIQVFVKSQTNGLTQTEHLMLKELWQIMGLDKNNSLLVNNTQRIVDTINQTITDNTGNVTVQRL
jgi:hypothetical protein